MASRTEDTRTAAPGPHDPKSVEGLSKDRRSDADAARAADRNRADPHLEGQTVQDPLAGRVDRPDYVPDADFKDIAPGDRRREGMFGGVLIFALPLAILVIGFFMWSTNVGTEGPAVDAPEVVADDQLLEPEDR